MQVLGSACVAALLFVLASVCTRAGRSRWAGLFAGWAAALPESPAARRALAWLPLIVVAKGLESAFGLPLLNWVYVAFGASTVLQAVSTVAAQKPVVPWAPSAGSVPPSAPTPSPTPQTQQAAGPAGPGGINALARGLFGQRFPALQAEYVLSTSPAMLTSSAGVQTQGQLYVTAQHLAFHGAFGRNARTFRLADISAAEPYDMPRGDSQSKGNQQLATLRVDVEGDGVVLLTAVNMLGGGDTLAIALDAWQKQREGKP